jgi:predicted dehydrogenase
VQVLRYGIVGAGFITGFQLRALEQLRGIEVAGLCSRRPPEALARECRSRGLGEARIYPDVYSLAREVDVVALFAPNFTRIPAMEAIAAAARDGARLRGLICEKPLARNLAEARRMLELAEAVGAPTAYFENQLHMKTLQIARAQLAPLAEKLGPPLLARASEEHAGPHASWFWDPQQQGGGVLSDMGCHCLALGWYALTPPGRPPRFLEPLSVEAHVSLLHWGLPEARRRLLEQHGVDYAVTPAEDFATGLVRYRNPESAAISEAQFTVSWMFEKQGLRLLLETLGPGYAFESNSLRSPLELFVGDRAARGAADAELGLEKATASRGLLPMQPNEPDLYGYTDEQSDAARAFREGRSALLDWAYGAQIVRLTMAAYLAAERGARVDLHDPKTAEQLERYMPLIQQGRGREVLGVYG